MDGYSFMLAMWLFLHAGTGPPIEVLLLAHAIMPYWEVHFLLNHVYGCVPA